MMYAKERRMGDYMDEMIVRPKYSRQTNPQRRRKKDNNDTMSTVFAAKLLAVVVFLSVFALCKAANTPATNFIISRVRLVATDNFDANKYLLKAATALGITLPTAKESTAIGADSLTSELDSKKSEDVPGMTNTGDSIGKEEVSDQVSGTSKPVTEPSSGDQTFSSSISDNISAITQTPVLEEKEIKALADKYSFIIPIKGDIDSPFGIRTDPLSGKTTFHSGIDIKANVGSNIKAALDGEVVEAGSSPEYDNYVKIQHNGGISTVYAHCSIIVAQKGQKVKQGDVIAKVGDTERVSGAYLHYEIWKDDKAVDPEKLLSFINQ